MGVLGAPLQPSGAIKKHLNVPEPPIYVKMVGLPVLIVLNYLRRRGSGYPQTGPYRHYLDDATFCYPGIYSGGNVL